MYLFFDTETTGLPKSWKAPVTDLDNWPRMIQIAWILFNEQGEIVEEAEHIVKPDGFEIPTEASDIHRVTTERANNEGVSIHAALHGFASAMYRAKMLIAHNISFDEKITGAEFLRYSINSPLWDIKRFCTMKSTTEYCQLDGSYGFKWPKMQELHVELFSEEFEEAHDALIDVRACAKCFFKLKNLHRDGYVAFSKGRFLKIKAEENAQN